MWSPLLIHLANAVILSWHNEGFSKHETKTQDEKKKWILLSTLKIRGEIESTFLKKTMQMTNLDSILKSRDITLPTEVHLVKAMDFQVVVYGCESWTIKKAECWRIEALNCGVWEDSWESLGLRGDPTSPS